MSQSPRYQIAYMATSSINKETIFNEAVVRLDALVNAVAISRSTSAPPGSPSLGDTYIVPIGATGAWADEDDKIAIYGNGWLFVAPPIGILIYVTDEAEYVTYDGSSGGWNPYALAINKLDDVPDVSVIGRSDQDLLMWNAADQEWRPATFSGGTVFEESDGTFTLVVTGSTLSVEDQSVEVRGDVATINFSGPLVNVVDAGTGKVRVDVSGPQIEDDGSVVVTEARALNFTGAGVTVSGDSDGAVDINITGGGGGGSADLTLVKVTETGTVRNVTSADFDTTRIIVCTNASTITFYVPDDIDAVEPMTVVQAGAGQVVFVEDGSGVTINGPGGADRTRVQYSQAVLVPDPTAGTDLYWLGGDITT